ARPTLDYVNKMLGLDRDAFFTSFFAKQKELNTLSDLKPAERKALIIRMLGIDRIDRASQLVRDDLREAATHVRLLETGLEDTSVLESEKEAEESLMGEALAALDQRQHDEERLGKLAKQFKKALEQGERQRETHSRLTEQYKIGLEGLKHVEAGIEQQKKELAELGRLRATVEAETAVELGPAETSLSEAQQRLAELKAQFNHERSQAAKFAKDLKKIDRLDGDSNCPTCLRPLGGDVAAVRKSVVGSHRDANKRVERLTTALEEQTKSLRTQKNAVDQLRITRDRVLKARARVERVGPLETLLAQAVADHKKRKTQVGEVLKRGQALKFSEPDFQKLKQEYEAARKDSERASKARLEAEHRISLAQMKLDTLGDRIKGQKAKRRQIRKEQKKRRELESLDELMGAFRKNLIGRVRPALSQKASTMLAEVTDNKYSKLELDEDYDVLLFDGSKKYPINRFSGGEGDLANLCLRLAISEVMTEASRSDFGFIILDEIFGSQDPTRKTNILKALAKLSNRFRQIFLITHIEEVKHSVEYALLVSEDETGSAHLLLN
ncbi:MAG: ATP-binding protein, partial [Terriglobia bacterium]